MLNIHVEIIIIIIRLKQFYVSDVIVIETGFVYRDCLTYYIYIYIHLYIYMYIYIYIYIKCSFSLLSGSPPAGDLAKIADRSLAAFCLLLLSSSMLLSLLK